MLLVRSKDVMVVRDRGCVSFRRGSELFSCQSSC